LVLTTRPSHITAILVHIGKFYLFGFSHETLEKEMLEHIFSGYPSWKLLYGDIPVVGQQTKTGRL